MRNDRRHHDQGFTLVELMIVVAVIGIIASLAIPNYMRFTARTSRSEMLETVSKLKLHFKNTYDNTASFVINPLLGLGSASAVNPDTAGIPIGQAGKWDTTTADWRDFQFPPEGGVRMRYSYTVTAPDTVIIVVCGSFSSLGGSTVLCPVGAGGGTANYKYQETFHGTGTSVTVEVPSF